MNEDRKNFENWYGGTLKRLYRRRHSGIAIAMISFPLFERYVRQKIRLPSKDDLSATFYDEVIRLVPGFTRDQARQFWSAVRHGLLHQVTMQQVTKYGKQLPECLLSHDISKTFEVHGSRLFAHPVLFAKRVVQIIRRDFATFMGDPQIGPQLMQVQPVTIPGGSNQRGIEASTAPLILTSSPPTKS